MTALLYCTPDGVYATPDGPPLRCVQHSRLLTSGDEINVEQRDGGTFVRCVRHAGLGKDARAHRPEV